MKVTIELDTATPADLEALQRMFAQQVPAEVAAAAAPLFAMGVAEGPVAKGQAVVQVKPGVFRAAKPAAPVPAPKAKAQPPAAKAIAERGKAMTSASKALGDAVGERAKLTRKQKARVAAKARWANHKKAAAPAKPAPKAAPAAQPKQASQPKQAAAKQARQPVAKPAPKPKGPPPREPKPQDYSRAEEQPVASFSEVAGHEVRQIGAEEIAPAFPDGRELLEGTFQVPQPNPEDPDYERTVEQVARELGGIPDAEPAAVQGV